MLRRHRCGDCGDDDGASPSQVEQFMPAVVGLATIGFALPAARSLKDKRSVVKGGIANLHNKLNVSIAEIGALGTFRRAEVAIAAVSNNRAQIDSIMDSAVRLLESDPRWVLEDLHVEIL